VLQKSNFPPDKTQNKLRSTYLNFYKNFKEINMSLISRKYHVSTLYCKYTKTNSDSIGKDVIPGSDTFGKLVNPHQKALEYIESDKPIDLDVINYFLHFLKYKINLKQYSMLISILGKEVKFPLDQHSENYELVGPVIMRSDPNYFTSQRAGVYIFTNAVTGDKYVGSSINLAQRIEDYILDINNKNISRRVIRTMRQTGLKNFTLTVYNIPTSNLN
jgi:hypothetical protein